MASDVLGSFTAITLNPAIHDAFELYGRPKLYSWDPRDSASMMFAYPIGPEKQVRPNQQIATPTPN